MGLVSQSDAHLRILFWCTRHDLLIKYVDVHAVDDSAADYSPKTTLILSNPSCKINFFSELESFVFIIGDLANGKTNVWR